MKLQTKLLLIAAGFVALSATKTHKHNYEDEEIEEYHPQRKGFLKDKQNEDPNRIHHHKKY